MHLIGMKADNGSNVRFALHLNVAAQQLGLWNGYAYYTQSYPFNVNTWYHIALVFSGSSAAVAYVNGSPLTAFAGTYSANTLQPLYIGRVTNGSDNLQTFSGQMDEIRIWNAARTQTQIRNNMFYEVDPAAESNLVLYYNFNQGSAGANNASQTTLKDLKSSINGTLYNFSLTGTTTNWITSTVLMQPATNVSFGSVSGGQVAVNWTSGNGTNRIVLMKQASSPSDITSLTDNHTYAANSSFGSGEAVNGWYCVYNGSENNATISGLNDNTTYWLKVIEYVGTAGNEKYFTDSGTGNPSTITTPLPVELVSIDAKQENDYVILTWKTATEINNHGFEIERLAKQVSNNWVKIGFVQGNGTSNSSHLYSFTDKEALSGVLSYRLKQIDNDGKAKYYDAVSLTAGAPKDYKLMQNSPNPFNPSTAIKFQLPVNSVVTLKVYDMLGKEIATLLNESRQAGSHIIYWNGKDNNGNSVSSGIYLYKLTAGSYTETRKMNFLK
jgi:hypothetical protein